jgi:hypothetical protein
LKTITSNFHYGFYDEAVLAMMLEQEVDDEETEEVDRYQTLTTIALIVVGTEVG